MQQLAAAGAGGAGRKAEWQQHRAPRRVVNGEPIPGGTVLLIHDSPRSPKPTGLDSTEINFTEHKFKFSYKAGVSWMEGRT